jgi:hypothetical protein
MRQHFLRRTESSLRTNAKQRTLSIGSLLARRYTYTGLVWPLEQLSVSDVKTKKSAGGAATSAGTTFQEDVACYLSTLILAGPAAEPPAGLSQGVTLSAIAAETPQPIDDLLIGTSVGGVLYIQAKTDLSLSDAADSELAKVIDQFVRQRLLGARPIGGKTRPLEPAQDRFILAVGFSAPATITKSLANVLAKCRTITDEGRLEELPDSLNAEETKALAIVRGHIQQSWVKLNGSPPTAQDELSVLHLMHVLQLDLRADGAALVRAKDLLRQVVLRDAGRAGDAWSALVSICRAFGPKRTGGDLAYLRAELESRDIPLQSVPSFKQDIEALRKYTADRQAFLRRLSFLELNGKPIKITREVAAALLDFASANHTAVIGEPGAGKSGCLYELADHLVNTQADVVLLAADMVNASSPEALAADLGISKPRSLVDVLQNWSGEGNGFLIVDALDAARSGMSLHVLCQILRDVCARAPRWHIVASIREYDLRTSPDVQDLFAGQPHATFKDRRFPAVRHVRIDRLSPSELLQVSATHTTIASALEASSTLSELVRNPFNLSLLCKLLDSHVSDVELSTVQTQVGLLDLYWNRRVEAGDPTGRLLVLSAAVEQMVAERELHVPFQSLAKAVATNTDKLDSLLSDGVLVTLAASAKAANIVAFAHNILFDYAVCRLWLDGLSDVVVANLSKSSNHDLLLAIRPSIVMAFEELWFEDSSRLGFWNRAIAFEQSPGMRLIGKIIAAGVAAQQFRHVSDAEPLIEALRQNNASGVALLRFTVQAVLTQHNLEPGRQVLIGEEAPEWMALAAELSTHLDKSAWEVRSLLWPVVQGPCSVEQAQLANKAAVALLRFGLANPPYHNVVRTGLEVSATTIASAPQETVDALGELLSEENLAIGAHEWLHPLAERLDVIAAANPEFALRIVDTVFRTSGDRDAAVPMGGRILSLVFNKRDLIQMARYDVKQVYANIWEKDPLTATRILLRVINAEIEEHHASVSKNETAYRVVFRGREITIRPDASFIWNAGNHREHAEWYSLLTTFKEGLKSLAKQGSDKSRVNEVLDVLRDEAEYAIVWSSLLSAGADEPETLASAAIELLNSTEVLTESDTSKAAGDLIASSFERLPTEARSAIETAISRIPTGHSNEHPEYAVRRRNRLLGCVPTHLLQSPELKQLRIELDAAGGPPPNEPEVSFSFGRESIDDDWWLKEQGVKLEKAENARLLQLIKAVKAIPGRKHSENFPVDTVVQHLALLEDADAAMKLGRDSGADAPLLQQVECEIIAACERLAAADGLKREMPLAVFIRNWLRHGATASRPEYRAEEDEQWDKDVVGWGSPSPRIDAAEGLLRLATNSEMVDEEILADLARLAEDPVPAVRYQVLSLCGWLYHTAPHLMWSLIEKTCTSEPRTGILNHFMSNVVLRFPFRDHERLESYARRLYHRCRRNETLRSIRQSCAKFYMQAALWHQDERAIRYIRTFANSPLTFQTEASTIIHNCRDLICYTEGATPEESSRVRKWALTYLTQVVKAVLACSTMLRSKHGDTSLDRWPKDGIDDLRHLHELAHNVATELFFGSGTFDAKKCVVGAEDGLHPSDADKAQLLTEGAELFDALCDIEFVESAYDVLQTLEFLIGVDHLGIILRVANLVRRAESDGIQYESMAADLVVRIVERYLSEHGTMFRENEEARLALLDILDVFVGAGWPAATRLTYRLGEVFR